MKQLVAPIDGAGRVVLPKSVRQELAISPGDQFSVFVNGADVVLRPRRQSSGLVRRGKALVFTIDGASLTREVVAETLVAERDANSLRITRRAASSKRKA